MEMSFAEHGVSPLRLHGARGREVGFDLRGCCCRREGGAVDEERFVLDGGVWDELVRRDVMG